MVPRKVRISPPMERQQWHNKMQRPRGIVLGEIRRYEMPKLGALQFVCERALNGGVTTSLALDAHGKSLSYALLEMTI